MRVTVRVWFSAFVVAMVHANVNPAAAQPGPGPVIGQCVDQTRQMGFAFLPNYYGYQIGNPMNQGQAVRDPSGQNFLRIPAQMPWQQAFFVTWDMRLIELNVWSPGPIHIGNCQFDIALPEPPREAHFNPAVDASRGVTYGRQVLPVPTSVLPRTRGLAPVRMATEQEAQACLRKTGGDRDEFVDCMIPKLASPEQARAYQCAKKNQADGDDTLMAACLAEQLVGENERRALRQAQQCYREHGGEWKKMPLCMASQQFDERTAAAVNCIAERGEQGDVTPWVVAGCAAGAALRLNPELTIAVECAMASGGEPTVFASCTGGQLTMRELNKCVSQGIGGSGCFGENNEIVKGLKEFGVNTIALLGPGGAGVAAVNTALNDLRNGPGNNNDIVRTVNTINSELQNAGQSVGNALGEAAKQVGLPSIDLGCCSW